MKYLSRILCAALLCVGLPSCLTLTAEIDLPNNGQNGGLSGRIGGAWSLPWPPKTEPALPVGAAGAGKNPVLPPP